MLYKVIHGRAPQPEDNAAPLLPPLYTIRTVSYGAKYAGAYAADPDAPSPPTVDFPSYIEVFAAVITAGIENFPKTKDQQQPGALGSHLISSGFNFLAVMLGIGHFLNMRRAKMKPKEALGMDILVSEIQGILEVFGAIAYTAECYHAKEVNPNTQARMAKSYLTAFPDIFWAGSMDKEPESSAIVGVIAVASYLGATVASAFVETNV